MGSSLTGFGQAEANRQLMCILMTGMSCLKETGCQRALMSEILRYIGREKMPTYEYKCQECDHQFDEFFKTISIAEKKKDRVRCPKCKGKTKRVYSGRVSFEFKGPGFYVNDYGVNDRIRKHIEKSPNNNQGDGSGRMLGDD